MPAVSQWQQHFDAATRDGSGNYVAGNIGIEDVVMDRMKAYLDDDPLVSSIFRAVEVIDLPFAISASQTPRLYLWSGNTIEQHAPTGVGLNEVRVFVGIVWNAGEVKVKPFGQPSVASVIRAVKNVLNEQKQLVEVIGGVEKPMARNSRLGVVDYVSEITDGGVLLQFDWIYEVVTALATGQIFNIDAA